MSVAERIETKLRLAFSPTVCEVIDESHLHKGHAGARPGGESHFSVRIVSGAFERQSRVDRQRLVMRALKEELAGPVHALRIDASAP